MMPGNHVATPDGRHVWEYSPKGDADLGALVKAAAAQVLPDAKLTAFEQRAVPGEGARLVTTLTRHPGGATVQVHARIDESFTLVYDAVVTRGGHAAACQRPWRPELLWLNKSRRRRLRRGRRQCGDPAGQPHRGRESRCGLCQVVAGFR